MQPILLVVMAFAALAAGVLIGWIYRGKLAEAETARAVTDAESKANIATAAQRASAEHAQAQIQSVTGELGMVRATLAGRDRELIAAREAIARLETQEQAFARQIQELTNARDQLRETFQALSAEALRGNNEQFIQLARSELDRVRSEAKADLEQKQTAIDTLVAPIRDTLAQVDTKLQEIERDRTSSFATLAEQISGMATASDKLRSETVNLSKALQSSNVRGSWGEFQLKRACELAGMIEHCDFSTQHTVQSEDGAIRPDVVVHLPGNRSIVIDSKAPATSYIEASNSDDPARQKDLLAAHAASVRKHVDALSKKSYWEQFDSAPDFVVLFLPNEALYSAAVQYDPNLLDYAVEQRVLLTTPTSLIGLLKVVALGWRQERIAESAQEVSNLGRELYDRLRVLSDHFGKIGKHLHNAVDAYNGAVGSIERNVFPQARRFEQLGAGNVKKIDELEQLDVVPRALTAPDWIESANGEQKVLPA